MNNATHVGEMLADELYARRMTQKELAVRTGIQPTVINEIIKGKRRINATHAIKLELVLGVDADFWLTAQMNYDIAKIKQIKS